MSVRVTREGVEVLADGSGGKARVSRIAYEALGGQGAEQSVHDILDLQHYVNSRCRVTGISCEVIAEALVSFARVTSIGVEVLADAATYDFEIDDPMMLVDTADVNVSYNLDVASALSLVSDALGRLRVSHHSVEDTLDLEHQIKRLIYIVEQSDLLLEERLRLIRKLQSLMNITDEAEFNRTKIAISLLALGTTIERQIVYDADAASALTLTHVAQAVIITAGILCRYEPQIGSGTTGIPATVPTLTPDTLTLFYPFSVSPTSTVVLRNPEFGNRIAYNANRINRKSRGGTKIVFRDPNWPKWRTLRVDISHLSQDQVDDFSEFLELTLGLEIGLKDHEGRIWKGIITTPDTEITQTGGRTGCESYATSFEFEGAIDDPP